MPWLSSNGVGALNFWVLLPHHNVRGFFPGARPVTLLRRRRAVSRHYRIKPARSSLDTSPIFVERCAVNFRSPNYIVMNNLSRRKTLYISQNSLFIWPLAIIAAIGLATSSSSANAVATSSTITPAWEATAVLEQANDAPDSFSCEARPSPFVRLQGTDKLCR